MKLTINDITPYGNNAKKHPKWQIEKLANSIKAFGCKQPLVLDKDNVLVAGHGRFEAMKLLGYTLLEEKSHSKKGEPCMPYIVVDDLDEVEVQALRLADNQLHALTESDKTIEVQELLDIHLKGFDIEIAGFEPNVIEMFGEASLDEQGKLDTMVQVEISDIIKMIEKRAKQIGVAPSDVINDLSHATT